MQAGIANLSEFSLDLDVGMIRQYRVEDVEIRNHKIVLERIVAFTSHLSGGEVQMQS